MPVYTLDFEEEYGALVTGGEEGCIRVWDLGRWRSLRALHTAHSGGSGKKCDYFMTFRSSHPMPTVTKRDRVLWWRGRESLRLEDTRHCDHIPLLL